MSAREMAATTERRITGRHVLFGMIAFFGIVIAVNGVFTWFALDTWTGLAVDKAYQKGLAYNDELVAADRQKALGWRSGVTIEGSASGRTVSVEMRDATGAPLSGLSIGVRFLRPTHEGMDREVAVSEQASGVYTGVLDLPEAGRWNVLLDVPGGDGRGYRMSHEVFVKP